MDGAPADRDLALGSRSRIACLSSAPWNPYLRLLYEHLAREGIELEPGVRLSTRWLLGSARRRVRWLHVHWPEGLYRLNRGPAALRSALSWLKVWVFGARLVLARALGYRIVWTIHQVYPHERSGRLDRVGALVLSRLANVLLAHDDWTAERVRAELGRKLAIAVVPHGSYVGFYPPGRSRDAVRAELGLPAGSCVFLSLGELRGYKDVDLLLAAFAEADVDGTALVVAGNVKDARVGDVVRTAAARDSRIRQLTGFVPVERVAELYGSADVAVLPRRDGGTSGSLILALSLGVPAIAADVPAYRALLEDGGAAAGWLFRGGDRSSLAEALRQAAEASEPERAERSRAAAMRAASLDWRDSARRTAELLVAAS